MKNPLDRAARYFGIGTTRSRSPESAPSRPRRNEAADAGPQSTVDDARRSAGPRGEDDARAAERRPAERHSADRRPAERTSPERTATKRRRQEHPSADAPTAPAVAENDPAETAPDAGETRAAATSADENPSAPPASAGTARAGSTRADSETEGEPSRSVSSRLGMDTDPVTEGEPARLGEEDWEEPEHQPVAARSFSGRTLLLLLIVIAVVVPLAKPVHTYFSQQAEVAALRQDISRLQSEQQDLKDQESRWNSDDYVREQARERLFYVQPGDVPYVVTGQDGTTKPADSSAEAATQGQSTWGQNLWQSVAGTAR